MIEPEELVELQAEREFLLASLRDLEREHDAGDLDERDYLELRDGYTARTAAILRTLDHARHPDSAGDADIAERAASLPDDGGPRRRVGRALVVTIGVVLFAVAAGWLVARASGTRVPGQTATGNSSNSIAALLAEARALQADKPDESVKRYIDVLKIDPANVEALTYRGWILRNIGAANSLPEFVSTGRVSIDKAIALDPAYPDARVFRGIIALRDENDPKSAEAQFDVFFGLPQPPQIFAEMVRTVDAEARTALGLPARAVTTSTTVVGSAATVKP